MAYKSKLYRISDEDLRKEIQGSKSKMFERYLECPVCGHEPFPGTVFRRGVPRIKLIGYFCPKCHAITLTIAVRVKRKYLPLLEASCNGRLADIQNRIDLQEEKELISLQKMKRILDTTKIYHKTRTV